MRRAGAYLPGVYETILETVQPMVGPPRERWWWWWWWWWWWG